MSPEPSCLRCGQSLFRARQTAPAVALRYECTRACWEANALCAACSRRPAKSFVDARASLAQWPARAAPRGSRWPPTKHVQCCAVAAIAVPAAAAAAAAAGLTKPLRLVFDHFGPANNLFSSCFVIPPGTRPSELLPLADISI